MAKMHGGKLVAKILKREGIKFLFSLCGGHINPVYDGCLEEGIKIIDTRHEQSAAHMAEGWGLATGETGVCCFTAGPGVTNAITGLVNASKNLTPVIAIGGSAPVNQYDMLALQELDQVSIMKSFARWARTVYDTKRIPEYTSMAFREAWSVPSGPVFLEIPWDIISNQIEESEVVFPKEYRTQSRPAGDPVQIEKAAVLLNEAERPVVIVGSGVFWAKAGPALKRFVERTRVPVFTRYAGKGVLPSDHELHFRNCIKKTLDEADVILIIGTRLDAGINLGNFGHKAKVVWVDTNSAEIGHNHRVDAGIVGDARLVLEQLTSAVSVKNHKIWLENLREKEKEIEKLLTPLLNSDSKPIHPLRLINEVQKFIERDATFVCEGGDTGRISDMVYKAYMPGFHMNTGMRFGCLGSGLPFAMSAKLARPDTQVILLTGDGTFGLNAMEFDTCVRHRINVVVVILNDQRWGMINRLQEQRHGTDRVVGTVLGKRPYHKVVEALGGYGELVEDPKDILPAIERAFASGVPACINVLTDTSVGPLKLQAFIDEKG